MIQMNCTALPHQKPLGTGTVALDAHSQQWNKWAHQNIAKLKTLLSFYNVIRDEQTHMRTKCTTNWSYSRPFRNLCSELSVPLLPTEPQKTHYLWKYTAKFTGSAGLASSAGLAADFKSCALGLPRGKQRSLHSTFLMGCNRGHVCFKPISELPALNPNSFFE